MRVRNLGGQISSHFYLRLSSDPRSRSMLLLPRRNRDFGDQGSLTSATTSAAARVSPNAEHSQHKKHSVNTVTRKLNIDVQFSATFVTFETVSFRMCTLLHINESLKPNSL